MARCILLFTLLLLAAVSDTATKLVSNRITIPFAAAGIVMNCFLNGFYGFWGSLAGCLIPVIILYILFEAGMLGAGDVKLLAAIGAIMGTRYVLFCSAFSFIAGAFMAVPLMIFRKNGIQRLKYFLTYCKSCVYSGRLLEYQQFRLADRKSVFRFSYAVTCGALISFLAM